MIKKLMALGFALGLISSPALAQVELGSGFSVTGSAVGQTDYMFRNISQTRNRCSMDFGITQIRNGRHNLGDTFGIRP